MAQMAKRRQSPYGQWLEAKQMVKKFYGKLTERQFQDFYQASVQASFQGAITSVTGTTNVMTATDHFIGGLESRIDVLLYRSGFATSVGHANQWVSHGKVLLNEKRVYSSGLCLKAGDCLRLSSDFDSGVFGKKALSTLVDSRQFHYDSKSKNKNLISNENEVPVTTVITTVSDNRSPGYSNRQLLSVKHSANYTSTAVMNRKQVMTTVKGNDSITTVSNDSKGMSTKFSKKAKTSSKDLNFDGHFVVSPKLASLVYLRKPRLSDIPKYPFVGKMKRNRRDTRGTAVTGAYIASTNKEVYTRMVAFCSRG
jgi:ribosomal protein S4